jgi:type I restriction enzyme S subunit
VREGWLTQPLGVACEVIAGQSPAGTAYNAEGRGLPFYQGKKEFGDKYIGLPTTWTSQITKRALTNDILMSVRAPVGPINFATQEICIGRGLTAIRARSGLDQNFLFYFLLSIQPTISGRDGAVFPSISRDEICLIGIPFPPLAEQHCIVAILDEAFAGLATATSNAEKNLKNARELFDSYLNTVFAAEWDKRSLGAICENLDSRRIPVTKKDRKPGSIPYYGASGAVDYVADYIFNEDLLLVSEDGANLLMRTYPIAFSISGKTWVNNHAHVLRFLDLVSQKFVEFYLNSISLKPYVNGMAQPKLNQKALNSIPVPFPSFSDRERTIAVLEELAEQTDRLRETHEARIAALAELKQCLLARAFAGELTSPPMHIIQQAAE